MKVKFFDFNKENNSYIDNVLASVADTLKSGHFILGPKVNQFESDFCDYLGADYCLGVGNGLDAIKIILMAIGVNQQSEVIVPAHTFIATWLPVTDLGAKIVPVEPDPHTYNMDIDAVERLITKKTKAIIAVHLYGRPVDVISLKSLGDQYGIPVIEDVAQAHGADVSQGIKCGSVGIAAAFSFYPTKNLGACGDAGAVVTNDASLYKKMKLIRNYGSSEKYKHECYGINSRMDEVQAAILIEKLNTLDELIHERKRIASYYDEHISSNELICPELVSNHVWHQYVLRVKNREDFIKHMQDCGIETLIHYPIPPHLSGVYLNEFSSVDFPITESICNQVVSLPIYPGLSEQELAWVTSSCNTFHS